MLTVLIIIGAVLLLLILIFAIVWKVRTRNFHPPSDKELLAANVNEDLKESGFAYELKGDYFYSLMNCWQREMGYCKAYDEGAPFFNMIMDCEPITFSYAGKRWLIELWKGQYGITTGGEIGIYNTTREDIDSEDFKGAFYEAASDSECLPLSFVLRKKRKVLMKRSAVHWWLTGFKLGEYSQPHALSMDAKITFRDTEMQESFVNALKGIGYTKKEYSVKKQTVLIHYINPHSPQSLSRNVAQETAVQLANRNNCGLYEMATHKYKFTLDKLEYLKAAMPEVYGFFLHSLYARGFYETFKWLIDFIHGLKPEPIPPKPIPPKPCPPMPPRPCPPESCPPMPPRPCTPESCPPMPPRPCPPTPPRPCPPAPPCPCPPRPCPPAPPCPCPPKPPCPCPPKPPYPCPPAPPRPCPPCNPNSCGSNNCRPCSQQPCRPFAQNNCPPRRNNASRPQSENNRRVDKTSMGDGFSEQTEVYYQAEPFYGQVQDVPNDGADTYEDTREYENYTE